MELNYNNMSFSSDEVVSGTGPIIVLNSGNFEAKLISAKVDEKTTNVFGKHQIIDLTLEVITSEGQTKVWHTLRFVDAPMQKSEIIKTFQSLGLIGKEFAAQKLPFDKLLVEQMREMLPKMHIEVKSEVFNGKKSTKVKRFIPSYEEVVLNNNNPDFELSQAPGTAATPTANPYNQAPQNNSYPHDPELTEDDDVPF